MGLFRTESRIVVGKSSVMLDVLSRRVLAVRGQSESCLNVGLKATDRARWSSFGMKRSSKRTETGPPSHDDLVRRLFTAESPAARRDHPFWTMTPGRWMVSLDRHEADETDGSEMDQLECSMKLPGCELDPAPSE